MAYGQSGHMALHFQNSFGLSNVTSARFIPLVSESVMETIGQLVENNHYGRLAESPVHEGLHEVSGEVRTEAHPIAAGAFFKAALGQSSSSPLGGAFLHTFVPVQADWDPAAAVPPFTLEIHRDVGSAFVYGDLLANTLTLEIAQGQLLAAGMTVLGGKFSQKASSLPVYPAGRPWTWDVVSAGYNGAGVSHLRSLTVKFDNRLAAYHTLSGGKHPARIKRNGSQTISVEGSLLFEDQNLFSEFINQTEKPLTVNFAGETTAGSYSNLLTVEVPRLRFSEFKPSMNGAGELEVGFAGKGVFDSGLGYGLKITLTNTQAAY
ncbi:MAG: phage tail tube protein [Deltaproteobacteria bacterium]|nr:phage tail tube protein [Deltaproteobacteria bacterium]